MAATAKRLADEAYTRKLEEEAAAQRAIIAAQAELVRAQNLNAQKIEAAKEAAKAAEA